MVLPFKGDLRIENPRKYPSEAVGELRALLSAGREAKQDPRRKNLYEIQGRDSTYYFFASPSTQIVVLLARFSRPAQPHSLEMARGVA